jgi:predicted cupin superfamily sugar epimerase
MENTEQEKYMYLIEKLDLSPHPEGGYYKEEDIPIQDNGKYFIQQDETDNEFDLLSTARRAILRVSSSKIVR